MKVLIVASYNKNRYAPFVVEQAESLQKAGCEIELFGVQRKGLFGYLREIPRLRKAIHDVHPDIIHAHYGLSCLVANLSTRRVPVVSTYHGSDINIAKVRRFSKIAMWLSAWNIFVSQRNVDIAKPRKRWSLIPCGVELSDGQLRTRAEARKALGWSASDKKILFAGAFDNSIKNPELAKAVIEYINKIIDKHCFAEINNENIIEVNKKAESSAYAASSVIANQFANEQDSLHTNCQSLSANTDKSDLHDFSQKTPKNDESEHIELIELKGYSHEQVYTLMCAANCLLMTSKTEGSPQVIKEAMTCGCPIVSVDVGDVAERTNGVEGCYVVPSRVSKDIAEALEKAFEFDGKTRGREKIIENGLSSETVAQRIIEIYKSIIK